MNKNNEGVFVPGTIVLQEINPRQYFVGVVCRDDMIGPMKKEIDFFGESEDLVLNRNKEAYHLCLVLGYFDDSDEDYRSWFYEEEKRHFPYYAIGRKELAVPTDLSEEVACYRKNRDDKLLYYGCGRTSYIGDKVFGFSEKQKETLLAGVFAQHYVNGGEMFDATKWFYGLLSGDIEGALFTEIQRAVIRP